MCLKWVDLDEFGRIWVFVLHFGNLNLGNFVALDWD